MLLLTNTDTIAADQVAYLIQCLMEAGAGNVHVVSALTKKGRPEFLFFIDVEPERLDRVVEIMARETGTLGLRVIKDEHIQLQFEERKVPCRITAPDGTPIFHQPLAVKVVLSPDGQPLSVRAEYEDIKKILHLMREQGIETGFDELKRLLEANALEKLQVRPFSIE